MEEQRRRVKINRRISLDHTCSPALCGKTFEAFSDSEAESVGISGHGSLCGLASPLVVTVLFSDVNVVCDVVFSDSDRAFVVPVDFFLALRDSRSE